MTTISEGPRSVADAVAGLDILSQAFIDGAYVDAVSGETFDSVSPITGEVVARVAAGDSADVDRADDAERLPDDRDVRIVACRGDLVVDLVDRLAVPGDALGLERDVDVRGVADRLPHVDRLEERQLLGVLGHQPGELLEHALALLRREP